MNGLERVFATIMGQPKDHVAVSAVLSMYGARLTGCSLPEYYNQPDKYFAGISAIKERFNPDVFFTPFVLAGEGESFGSKVKYLPNNPPNVIKPAINKINDIINLPLPDIYSHPRQKYYQDAVKLMVNKFGKENAIGGVMVSPIDLPPLILGLETWLDTILFHRKEADLMCEKTMEYFIKRANSFFDAGVNFIVLPVVFCNPAIITRQIVEEFALPCFREAFSQVKGPIVIHHGGSIINSFLDLLGGLPNVAAFQVDHKDNLGEARKLIGNSTSLLGNIDGPSFNRYSIPHVELICKQILEDRANDKHFILSTSSADIPFDTPPEIIDAFLNSVKKFSN